MNALDLFAGPGGMDLGCVEALGIEPLGIELDPAACLTREAAGRRTVAADVSALRPLDAAPVDLLMASAPCPPWSQAGQKLGLDDWPLVHSLTDHIAHGDLHEDGEWADPRSRLITEPLRWALALVPRWIVLEQVPPVLDYWRHLADVLELHGWSCWTGILEAERYGVPQTRERAFLLADRERQPHPPAPTHQRYVPGEVAQNQLTIDGELLPWVSMAEALGWDDGGVLSWARRDDTGTSEDGYRERDRRPVGEPALTLTEKARSWTRTRPATTVACEHRIFRPGSHHALDGRNSTAETHGRSDEAIRVSPEEAAVLQGFPADYPFRGSRTQRFVQIGNAVPPPWAAAILRALCGVPERVSA